MAAHSGTPSRRFGAGADVFDPTSGLNRIRWFGRSEPRAPLLGIDREQDARPRTSPRIYRTCPTLPGEA